VKKIFTVLAILVIVSCSAASCVSFRDVSGGETDYTADKTTAADVNAADTNNNVYSPETELTGADSMPEPEDIDFGFEEDQSVNAQTQNMDMTVDVGSDKVISFLTAGDNVIHPCIYLEAKQRATANTREYHFKPMYADVVDLIGRYDFAFINQETLMGGADLGYMGYPRFNSPQDLGCDLVEMGFDIVNIANNHMVDQWEKGLRGTIEFWRNQPVTLIGDVMNKEEYEIPDIIEKDGVSIAFLSYTYGTNGLALPASSELIVPYIDDKDILRHVENAKEMADLVFVSMHWGEENISKPTLEQVRVGQLMADAGVDVIIGHHPHVMQPIEWLTGEDGNRTLCIYSLGNLVSAMMYSQNMVGGFITFDVVSKGGAKPYIDNVQYLPTVFFYGMNYYSTHLYMMEDYTDAMAAKHGTQIYKNYASAAQMRKFATDVIAAEFLPDWMKNS